LVATCTPKPHPTYRIGFAQNTAGGNWQQALLADMERELVFHPEVQLLWREARGETRRQAQQVEELLQQKVDVLIISPVEDGALDSVLQRTMQRGVPVLMLDHHNLPHYTAYIGCDNQEIGAAAGRYAAQLVHQRGQVVEIVGVGGVQSVTHSRHIGFTQALRAYPGMELVGEVAGKWGNSPFQPELAAMLQAHPKVNLIFAHSDVMAGMAHEVVSELGRKNIRIIGVDGLPGPGEGLEMVSQQRTTASLLNPLGGGKAIQLALRILHQQAYEKENQLSTIVIDSTNVLTLRQQAAELASQYRGIKQQQQLLSALKSTYASQRTVLNGLLVTLLVALLLGAIAGRAARTNRRINHQLRLQNEENDAINHQLTLQNAANDLINQQLAEQNAANDAINQQLNAQNEEILAQRNQLAELAEQARVETEAKLRFFTNFSHELRTPLTLILGPVDELLTGPGREALLPAQRHDLVLVRRNTERLLHLVNQLMDFRKIDVGKMAVRATEANLVSFLREITAAFEKMAQRRKIRFRFLPAEPVIRLWFDGNILDKVFFNLLSNAFKYTPDGGQITVSIQRLPASNAVRISVEDNGQGIAKTDQPHILEWFYQGSQPSANGSGVGLALAGGLTRLHQGTLSFRSQLGQGSTFEVTLPLARPLSFLDAEAAPAPVLAPPLFPEEEVPAFSDEGGPARTNATALLIEDNAEVRDFLLKKLQLHFQVSAAADGATGLRLASETIPDVIVCDVNLPELSGLEVAAALKGDWRTSHIPLVLLTAQHAPEQQVAGVQAGADLYLTKPFNPTFLLESLRTLLRNRDQQREHFRRELSVTVPTVATQRVDQAFLADLTAIIEVNLERTALTVDDIASTLGVSAQQLYRKVKALLGTGVNEYIQNVRLTKARLLLLDGGTIAEVAYQTGFSSPAYFSNAFKRKYQVTPSEFRALHMPS